MTTNPQPAGSVAGASIPLDRDVFLRSLVRELAGTLEDVVGLDEAAGFVSVVGQTIGAQIGADYKRALGKPKLSRAEIAEILTDLKRRIQGDFFLIEQDETKIVLGNRACPFGDKVRDRRSMCMMTSNVFGSIAADDLGYAKVELQKTIAAGDRQCRVVVHLARTADAEAAAGREYFGAGS